jgi:hypothetical protein
MTSEPERKNTDASMDELEAGIGDGLQQATSRATHST